MTHAPAAPRAEVDRCPGVLRPHQAADGALLRLRVPGGWLPASSLDMISAAAATFGDGAVQLTSRANLQLRAVTTEASGAVCGALVDEVVRAGLLPYPSHERVRNIVCSPLSGLSGGLADLRGLTRGIDEKLCSAVDLAGLPGPFLFALDDGRGDLDAVPADLRIRAVDRQSVQILVGDAAIGPVVPIGKAADVLIALCRAFLRIADDGDRPVWHVRELPQRGLELLSQIAAGPATLVRRRAAVPGLPLGRLTQDDGRAVLSALVPLGLLDRRQVTALTQAAAQGSGQLVVTPWRVVLVPDLPFSEAGRAADALVTAGLELNDSPWQGVTACTGAPRCAHGLGETRSLAGRIVRERASATVGALPVHVVGCSRRCGSPSGSHVEALSLPGHVEISRDGRTMVVPVADAPAAVWGSR